MFKFVSNQIAAARRAAEDQERLRRKRERCLRFLQEHPDAAAIREHAGEAARERGAVSLSRVRDEEPLRYLGYLLLYLTRGTDIPEGMLEGWPGPEPERALTAGLPDMPGAGLGALAVRMGEVQGKGYLGGLAAIRRQGRQGYLDEKMADRIGRSLEARNALAKRLGESVQAEEGLRQTLHDSQMAELRRRAEMEAAQRDPALLLPAHLRPPALPAPPPRPALLPAWQEAGPAGPPARPSAYAEPDLVEESAVTLVLLAEEQGWIGRDEDWERGLAEAERELEATGAPTRAVLARARELRLRAGH